MVLRRQLEFFVRCICSGPIQLDLPPLAKVSMEFSCLVGRKLMIATCEVLGYRR